METEQKILAFMSFLKETFNEPKRLSLATICKLHNVPTEYMKWIVEDYMEKEGGARGIIAYTWRGVIEPTYEKAAEYVAKYNRSRARINKAAKASYGQAVRNMESDIKEIKSLLQKIASQNI